MPSMTDSKCVSSIFVLCALEVIPALCTGNPELSGGVQVSPCIPETPVWAKVMHVDADAGPAPEEDELSPCLPALGVELKKLAPPEAKVLTDTWKNKLSAP